MGKAAKWPPGLLHPFNTGCMDQFVREKANIALRQCTANGLISGKPTVKQHHRFITQPLGKGLFQCKMGIGITAYQRAGAGAGWSVVQRLLPGLT